MKKYTINTKIWLFLIVVSAHFFGTSQTIEGSFESKFKRYQKNENYSGTPSLSWNAVAWKGERLHKQIVLWSNTDINGLTYTVSDFTNNSETIPSTNTKIRFGQYIKGDPEARSCSEYPTHPDFVEIIDALSDKEITDLNASDPLKLWLTINVPASTPAGSYTGTITVNGGSDPLFFSITLQVVNYTLPDVVDWNFHLDIWQFPLNLLNHYNADNPTANIETWSDQHFDLLEPFYKLLADTGQKTITTYVKDGALGAESMVQWIKKSDDTWEYDFTAFDKYVSTLMSWGITKQISCFSPVGWNEETIPYWDEATNSKLSINAPLGSSTYNERWNNFLSAFKEHLDNKGWFDKAVLYLDEVSETKLNNVVSMVKGNNQNWKLGLAYSHGLSNASKANFYDLSGILEDASNNGIANDKISTFYTSCTQTRPNNYVTPGNSSAEMTWMAWHAFNEGFDGYLRWAFDYWRLSDPFDARDGGHTAGDFSMVYRAFNNTPSEVLSSIRFEMLRDGIQDFEKLRILKALLEASSDPEDVEILNELLLIISKFGKASGVKAEQLVIEGQAIIEGIVDRSFNIRNDNFTIESIGETCTGKANGQIHITSKKSYRFEVSLDGVIYPFITELTIEDLESKNYTFCITSPFKPSFEQCYELGIADAPEISAKTTISAVNGKSIVRISLDEGSPPFSISINHKVVAQTTNKDYKLEVEDGDVLSISTSKPCQGTFTQKINLDSIPFLYPNPTKEIINLVVSDVNQRETLISIFNLQNELVFLQKKIVKNHNIPISMATLSAGMYVIKVDLNTPLFFKIIKQ